MEGVIDQPEQPEPMTILRQLRRFNSTWWQGGYADQPWILMHEMNVVIEAEIDHENILNQNRYMQALQEKHGAQTP